LSIGTITATVKTKETINGKSVVVLEATAKSKSIVSVIHKVNSRFVTYMDVQGLYPLRLEVYRNDSDRQKAAVLEFDQVHHKVHEKNFSGGQERVVDVPARVQDIMSLCYYFRLAPLGIGDKKDYAVFHNDSSRHFCCGLPPKP